MVFMYPGMDSSIWSIKMLYLKTIMIVNRDIFFNFSFLAKSAMFQFMIINIKIKNIFFSVQRLPRPNYT